MITRPDRCCRNRMQACFMTVKVPFQVHCNDVVPLLLAHIEDHPVPQDSVAGDDGVQLAVGVNGGLDYGLAALHGGHRLLAGHGLAAGLANLCRHLLGDGLVGAAAVQVYPGVNDHHPGSLGGHLLGHALADATAGAGYDCNFVLKKVGHLCAPVMRILGHWSAVRLARGNPVPGAQSHGRSGGRHLFESPQESRGNNWRETSRRLRSPCEKWSLRFPQ